jgi:hypothetical protein
MELYAGTTSKTKGPKAAQLRIEVKHSLVQIIVYYVIQLNQQGTIA